MCYSAALDFMNICLYTKKQKNITLRAARGSEKSKLVEENQQGIQEMMKNYGAVNAMMKIINTHHMLKPVLRMVLFWFHISALYQTVSL